MARISYDQAYPGIQILPRSRNWWARLKGTAPECIHMGQACEWIVTLVPDILYLRGKKALRRQPARPELTMCLSCLSQTAGEQMEQFPGQVIAFEPDPELVTQYFFVAPRDFKGVGLRPEVGEAISRRLGGNLGDCRNCGHAATWLWFSREDVASLDEVENIAGKTGERFCPRHGVDKLFEAFDEIPQANLFYMNLPYDEAGAYVWI